jgi:hypothetical protein
VFELGLLIPDAMELRMTRSSGGKTDSPERRWGAATGDFHGSACF